MTTAMIILTVVTFSYMFYDLFTRKTWMDKVLEDMENT
jgi:hypothetical protein